MTWEDPDGQKWKNLSVVGKLASSLCAIAGTVSLVGVLAWSKGSGGMFWQGRIDMQPWNLVGGSVEWVSGLNILLAFFVIGFFHRPRGWFGLFSSGIAFIVLLTAGTAMGWDIVR